MAGPAPVLATAVSLRLTSPQVVRAGSGLWLTAAPDAQAIARTVLGSDPILTEALAIGLGTGTSPYYQLVDQAKSLVSPALRIESGSALVDGLANAFASSVGLGDTAATATALQTGLAGIDWRSNYAGNIEVGTEISPLAAVARSSTGAQLPLSSGRAAPTSTLASTARVRGIESSTILGQPNANVAARAELDLTNAQSRRTATGVADSYGLDAVIAQGTSAGNGSDTRFSGVARSELVLELPASQSATPVADTTQVRLTGPAIGINNSQLTAGPGLNTTFRGEALATIDLQAEDALGNPVEDPLAEQAVRAVSQVDDLRGIGINNTSIRAGQGNTTVIARGGVFDDGVAYNGSGDAGDNLRAAGLNNSTVVTGSGNDTIFGKILTESEAQIDANGDGVFSSDYYLTNDADSGGQQDRFNGIRNSTVLSGDGDDTFAGSSSGSWLYGMAGDDSFDLDLARDSSLWGSYQKDVMRVKERSENVVNWGNMGDDTIEGALSGFGNTYDGGLNSDVISGTDNASDAFLFTDANAALTAASTYGTNQQLTDTAFWAGLSEDQKQEIWLTGKVGSTGSVDVILNFEAGVGGDVIELNSSIGAITQSLWEQNGAIYSVNNKGTLSLVDAGSGTAQPNKSIAVVVGTLADIRRMGAGVTSIAYATDTHQLMFDADSDWRSGSVSLGTVNTTGTLAKNNFRFGSVTASAMGPPATAPGL